MSPAFVVTHSCPICHRWLVRLPVGGGGLEIAGMAELTMTGTPPLSVERDGTARCLHLVCRFKRRLRNR